MVKQFSLLPLQQGIIGKGILNIVRVCCHLMSEAPYIGLGVDP